MKKGSNIVIIFFVLTLMLMSCNKRYLENNKTNEIDVVFEQDYVLINDVVEYLLLLDVPTIYIDCDQQEIKGEFGEKMEFNSPKIEQIIAELSNKGYGDITKKDSIVSFGVWEKMLNVEFESGFVYSANGTDNLSGIQFLTYQQPLSKENWYYYEADYNKWRSINSGV